MATITVKNENDNNNSSSSFSCITQTELGFNDLQHLCNGGKHAFTNANYHQAIDIYDQVIAQLQGSLTCKIYLFRAGAYEQLGNFHHALQDAQRAILADPTYAGGYLCAGSLFVMQKQWAEAAALYQKGIDRVAIDDPRHIQLVQHKEQVAHEIAERNTRVMRILPYDIICEIMSKLSITDRIACAQTCKDWHAYMFDSPAMWQDIHHLDASLLDRIGSVASKHVRRLTLRGLRRNQELLGRLVEFNWHFQLTHQSILMAPIPSNQQTNQVHPVGGYASRSRRHK
ncbi:hypothetical protein BDB00DRAFT_23685 [Zychaea mexicana]|uniref:uncharacterized protein n=1 Tax=Zychaea mexicana TaxID=64656 RepID=UPI0022FEDB08|nr:uncharacterized protein BDB00DRAFT_23685 [Zychaea mexicana]KAI9497310.1 hypothetical protein BDB00DRAFT_23685 [Zychaea mexicana]